MFAVLFLLLYLSIGAWCSLMEEERRPIYLSAHVGDSVVFSCDMDFPHDVVVPYVLNWNKEGKRVFAVSEGALQSAEDSYVGRLSVLQDGTRASVNLTAVREPDRGWYECRLTFPNRSPPTRLNGTWFHLSVHGSDLLGIPPINQTVVEGEEARFECVTKDPEARIVWLKDGVELGDMGDLATRSTVTPEGTLVIEKTGISDPGMFTCQVTGKGGDHQSANAFLDVQYKARVVYTPKEVFLPFGRPGILDCDISANPPTTKIRWEKDGFLFDPFNVQGVFLRRNGSLYFNKVDDSHAGDYTCTPYNDLGTAGMSSPINVVVQKPPVFTLTPHNMYLKKIGDTVIMPCEAIDGEDAHRPTIVWFKRDGTPLPADRIVISGGNLTLNNIKDSDRGLYQCVASNEAATISADTELLVENTVPRAPYSLVANVSHNSINLVWKPGHGVNSHHYSVWFRPIDKAEWRSIKVSGPRATIANLEAGKEYEIFVVSREPNGDGMLSKPIKVRIKGTPSDSEAPQGKEEASNQTGDTPVRVGPPRNLRISLDENKWYVLKWDAPEYGTEAVNIYKVQWGQGSVGIEEPSTAAETKDTTLIIGVLEEDATYHFRVRAMSNLDAVLSTSDTFVLHVPYLKKADTLSLFVAGIIGFMVAFFCMCIYINRLYVRSHIRSLRNPQ